MIKPENIRLIEALKTKMDGWNRVITEQANESLTENPDNNKEYNVLIEIATGCEELSKRVQGYLNQIKP